MSYLIYLNRSYKRRFKRHLMLYVILTCAMILPLIISIFRDSKIFGQQSFVQQYTRGQAYHAINAKPEYLEYFKSIPGLTSYYEDNTIFINFDSEEDASNPERIKELDQIFFSIRNIIQDERLVILNVSHFGSDESNNMFANQLLFVNAFIMIISFIIIQSAYKNHLNKFTPDIGVLVSYGADNRQIRKIFLVDFIVTFMISALSSVAISSVLMYILFHIFFQVKDVGNLSWMIFRVDPLSIVVHILVFGSALLSVVILCLNQKLKQTSIKMLRSNENGEKLKHYKKTMEIRRNSVKSLGRLLSHRTKRQVIGCLMISVPITFTVIFIFNYLIINIESISKSPDYEITIQKDALTTNEAVITNDDISFVKGIEGVKIVKEERNLPTTKYLIKDDRAEEDSLIVYGNDRYAQTAIRPYSDIENTLKNKELNSNKYNVAINKNHEYLKYKVGDKILLYFNEIGFSEEFFAYSEDELGNPDIQYDHAAGGLSIISKPIELTVVQLLDYVWTDQMFPIYFTDEMYLELTKDTSVSELQVKLDNPSKSNVIESVLKSKFIGAEYTITNNQVMFEKNKETTVGIYIMALFIFSIMFAFILVILYVKLTDYAEAQNENIRLFHILGASKSDIYDSYMRLPLNVSMLSIIVSFTLGLGLCILFFRNSGYHLIMNLTTISVHLIIAMLILAAFNLPVHSALKKKMKQL